MSEQPPERSRTAGLVKDDCRRLQFFVYAVSSLRKRDLNRDALEVFADDSSHAGGWQRNDAQPNCANDESGFVQKVEQRHIPQAKINGSLIKQLETIFALQFCLSDDNLLSKVLSLHETERDA